MSREQVFEIFTVCGWVRVDRETWFDHKGIKRWKWDDEDHWHPHGYGYDDEEE